ncbi:MAG: hypothetical protein KatS3mg124_0514 [Porticoccaceae bacterium]|nr:MAG: hypothetical protein KatS3mg124_0514 [Porticoccaceae bacterium]
MSRVRLDKWLWAARFFRTRSLAQAAVEGGKVKVAGERTKPGRSVTVGMRLEIRRGGELWEVEVTGLSQERRGATEAALLYRETEASRRAREAAAAARKSGERAAPARRPSARERRAIRRLLDEPP